MGKALTGAQRTQRSTQKRKDAGLIQIKVWVVDQRGDNLNGVKSEAIRVREYAVKQPLTKAIIDNLQD